MKAATVNHGPDHVLTSVGVGKPVGPQRHSLTPTAAHTHPPWQLFLVLKEAPGTRQPLYSRSESGLGLGILDSAQP